MSRQDKGVDRNVRNLIHFYKDELLGIQKTGKVRGLNRAEKTKLKALGLITIQPNRWSPRTSSLTVLGEKLLKEELKKR